MSRISVVLPAPFGPSMPTRSPRITRRVTSSRMRLSPKLLPTFSNSATSLPERSPVSTVSLIEPMRSRRAARSSRRCSSRLTRPSLRVRRASTPLRIHTSSCAQNFSKRRWARSSAASISALRCSYTRVVARKDAQPPAIELGDARGHRVEETPVVGDDHAGDVPLQQFFERSRCRRRRDGWSARRAAAARDPARRPAPAPRACVRRRTPAPGEASSFTEKRCRNSGEPRLGGVAVALVGDGVQLRRVPAATRAPCAACGNTGSCSTSATRSPGLRCTSPSSSAMLPASTPNKDDLPVPLRPMRPTRSPSAMASEARSSSGVRPNASSASLRAIKSRTSRRHYKGLASSSQIHSVASVDGSAAPARVAG